MLTETVNEREATKAETFQKHILPSSMAKMVWILGAILLACVILAACTGNSTLFTACANGTLR